jgi:hypothetical protein
VAGTAGFAVGDGITINPGGANEETNVITGFASLVLQHPLQFDHAAGELIVDTGPASECLTKEQKFRLLLEILWAFNSREGQRHSRYIKEADLNNDGRVNFEDLKILAETPTCPRVKPTATPTKTPTKTPTPKPPRHDDDDDEHHHHHHWWRW